MFLFVCLRTAAVHHFLTAVTQAAAYQVNPVVACKKLDSCQEASYSRLQQLYQQPL